MNKIWPFTVSALFFAGVASVMPFIVLYFQELGFTGTQIGLLTSITPLIGLFSGPLWTGLADATGRHRLIMSLVILIGMMAVSVLPLLNTFAPILLVSILFNIFFAPISSFTDSAAMFMLADEKEMYGRIRLGGTIGYGMAASIAGVLVENYGLRFAFWGCAAVLLVAFVVSQKLVYSPLKADVLAGGGVRGLLMNPRWPIFLTVIFAGGLALAATNNYFSPYMKELGADESMMGLALTVGTISEIPVLFWGNQLIKRLKPYGLLVVTIVVAGIRLLLLAASGTPSLVFFIQLLNGLTFPAMWVAGVSYADENAPAGMSTTAQGLLSAAVSAGSAVGGFLGGLLLENVGGRGLYLVFGVVALATTAVAALIHRRLHAGQRTSPDATVN
jgi:PPP family 3-phenylpropionic acid transporter